ncbi:MULTISPECIES: NUMOD4 motif-containing HNH endonuclease [unclassified Microbacterium]|uniref:NUMOD4 motif-containing HNH endonuclease n=1 Tax=Microbacterium TaxID=33882 RepID=UPI003B9EDCDC
MTTIEQWSPIPGHAGYEASTLGRIRSVDRVIPHGGKSGTTRTLRGRVLRPCPNGPYGYLSVMLGAGCRRYVHRLVAATFLGPVEGMDVDHGDDDPSNNAVTNLTIMPHADNMLAIRTRRAEKGRAA